jgi:hypothetical protein
MAVNINHLKNELSLNSRGKSPNIGQSPGFVHCHFVLCGGALCRFQVKVVPPQLLVAS